MIDRLMFTWMIVAPICVALFVYLGWEAVPAYFNYSGASAILLGLAAGLFLAGPLLVAIFLDD